MVLGPDLSSAHEVRPAVADITITGNDVSIKFGFNAEALLAGIDLSAIIDTNEAENAAEYDRLRALSATELSTAVTAAFGDWQGDITARAGGEPVGLTLSEMTVTEEANVELPRDAFAILTATLPEGDTPVTLQFAPEFGEVVVRQMGTMENPYTGFLSAGVESAPIPREAGGATGALETFVDYVVIGFEHIIPKGLDHILFVLGLFFLSPKLKPLLWQISAFTLAHSITLALATLGLVSVPASVVEPLIAASIVYVAVENIVSSKLHSWRPLIIFAFGLLHGLGFASVLGDIGLDPQRLVLGLVAFNIGVEIGQLTVIAAAFLAVGFWFNTKTWYKSAIAAPASLAIAATGAWWFYERVFL